MNPLGALYGAGVSVRNRLYDRGLLPAHRLQAPVVSIGSISAGGAGKTPFVIMLGEWMKRRNIAFNVLSRGYGRKSKGVRWVDPAGPVAEFGDEPLLIARRLGVPVIVGEDRYAAGLFAEKQFGLQVHLLDDGFQHRRLARDFDLVLFTGREFHDRLLPGGRLREPLSSLERASGIVHMTDDSSAPAVEWPGRYVWQVVRGIVPPQISGPCFAFCGIARPAGFFTDLGKAGVQVVGTRAFRDHHAYTAVDVEALYRQGGQSGATAFVTTEKDAVNLGEFAERLRPLHVVTVTMELGPGTASSPDLVDAVMRCESGSVRK